MSRKSKKRKQEREPSKAKAKVQGDAKPKLTAEELRRRRNRRYLVVGLLAISFPILEVIAYQFRTITLTIVNRSDVLVKSIKFNYSGGNFEVPELKPGGSATRVIRPDYSFNLKGDGFSTYTQAIRLTSEDGQIIAQMGRAGGVDFSATEVFTIISTPPKGQLELQHTSRPGFPLSLVRDLMERLGFG